MREPRLSNDCVRNCTNLRAWELLLGIHQGQMQVCSFSLRVLLG